MSDKIVLNVKEFIKENHLLSPSTTVIVALSGGADSVALFYLLLDILPKEQVVAAHFNHRWRGDDSQRDEDFVKKICKEAGVKLYCGDVLKMTTEINSEYMTEAGARQARYKFLYEVAANYNDPRIALAHHMDDQGETILLNCRGTGLRGIGGIRPINGQLIRPLLCLRRQEIEIFLRDRGIQWCHDITNDEIHTPRNKLRLEIIPELNKLGYGDIIPRLCDTSDQAMRDEEYLVSCAVDFSNAEGRPDLIYKSEDSGVQTELLGMHFRASKLQDLSDAVLSRVVIRMVQLISGRVKDITAAAVKRAIKWIRNDEVSGYLDICHGVSLVKRRYRFYFVPIPDFIVIAYLSSWACTGTNNLFGVGQDTIISLPLRNNAYIEYESLIIYITFIENHEFIDYNSQLWIEFSVELKDDIHIRSRRPGDRFIRPHRSTRKVKQIMNEYGLPRSWRDRIGLVAIAGEKQIVGFFGCQDVTNKSKNLFKANNETKIRIDISSGSTFTSKFNAKIR